MKNAMRALAKVCRARFACEKDHAAGFITGEVLPIIGGYSRG
jgi:hypothetical protein